jgi:hypothetical protein
MQKQTIILQKKSSLAKRKIAKKKHRFFFLATFGPFDVNLYIFIAFSDFFKFVNNKKNV